jgi:hypothetical protein
MAITASIALSSATCDAQQSVGVVLTVANDGGSSVNVVGLQPYASPTGTNLQSVAVALGQPPIGPGMTVSVAAAGERNFAWPCIPQAPQSGEGWQNPTSQVYDIGCWVYTSDGSVTKATTTTLTVSTPDH